MKIHCDGCGKVLDQKTALERTWDGETFAFCSEACARSGSHLSNDIYADEEGGGVGPIAPGDVDETPTREPRWPPHRS